VSELCEIKVSFAHEGIMICVSYGHTNEPPQPGTKTRTRSATRMAAYGLRRALEGLDKGTPIWGGFATNTRTSRDTIIVDREESAA
jgi:hypothetical protein